MTIPTEEQETIIRIGRADDIAVISTSDTTMMTRLDKLVETSGEWHITGTRKFKDGSVADKTYECPKQFVSFRSKKVTRVLTEEEKKAMAERLRTVRERSVQN